MSSHPRSEPETAKNRPFFLKIHRQRWLLTLPFHCECIHKETIATFLKKAVLYVGKTSVIKNGKYIQKKMVRSFRRVFKKNTTTRLDLWRQETCLVQTQVRVRQTRFLLISAYYAYQSLSINIGLRALDNEGKMYGDSSKSCFIWESLLQYYEP